MRLFSTYYARFLQTIVIFAAFFKKMNMKRRRLFNKREVLVFRQFKRKGWALFASLGREVVISVLSVATLSSAHAATLSGEVSMGGPQADTTRTTDFEVRLGDVGVTGSRAPLAQSRAARMVTVLTRDDIQAAPVQSVNDLLKMAVGVDVRQRGALGTQTDVSIRGGTQEQVAVLLNGINICDPQTGHNTLDLPCQLSEIVRVEVLEGPAGRAYGTSSLVGAINIVTATTKGAELTMEGGSYGYAKAAVVASSRHHSLSGSYGRSDGYSHAANGHRNTDYSGSKAFYQGSYRDSVVHLSWHVGLADKGWGSGTFYATPRWQADDQYEHTTKLYTALQGASLQGAVRLRGAVYWNQNRDRYEGWRDRPEVMKFNYNRCCVYGTHAGGYADWMLGRTAFGAELRREELVSSNLGEPLSRPHPISGTNRDYTLGISRTNLSAHLEHNVLLRRLTVSTGFVVTKSSQSDMDWQFFPGIDVSWRPFADPSAAASRQGVLRLFASYNSSLRLPSFTEMYYHLQGYAADPHLKPEEMRAVEVGAQYSQPGLQAKAVLYHHHGSNLIDWIMDASLGDEAHWQSVNHTRINSIGLETCLDLVPSSLFPRSSFLATRLASLHLSYSYMHQDKDLEPGVVSQYALEYLRHKLLLRTQWQLGTRLGLALHLRWQDRYGTYTDFAGRVCDYRPYALVDARIYWTASRYTLYAEANNLLDNRRYVDFGNVPQPGLWLIGGIKFTLN